MLRSDERIHDVTASVESVRRADGDAAVRRLQAERRVRHGRGVGAVSGASARFDVQVNQALPFLNFTQRAVGDARRREQPVQGRLADTSVYDELLVVRPPKRVLGGVTVRF